MFFYPNEKERSQIASLAEEIFAGHRIDDEMLIEYKDWLPYITEIFLPCIDSETGDFRHFPFEGSLMDQPHITMQILKLLQLVYRQSINKKRA